MEISKFQNCLSITELDFENLQEIFVQITEQADLGEKAIQVKARTLTPVEAIGEPQRRDYPLIKGREAMVEACLDQATGQAFTDMPSNFSGSLKDLCSFSLADNAERAIFVAALNAVCRYLGWIEKTVHCKNEEPEECASHLPDYVRSILSEPRIAFIGLQPAMVDRLSGQFPLRVADMDKENVGKEKYGLVIESEEKTAEILNWANIVLATGSTVVNNTFRFLLCDKPLVFYGVTSSAISYLTGCRQFCVCGK